MLCVTGVYLGMLLLHFLQFCTWKWVIRAIAVFVGFESELLMAQLLTGSLCTTEEQEKLGPWVMTYLILLPVMRTLFTASVQTAGHKIAGLNGSLFLTFKHWIVMNQAMGWQKKLLWLYFFFSTFMDGILNCPLWNGSDTDLIWNDFLCIAERRRSHKISN